jgi:hypothetical protein
MLTDADSWPSGEHNAGSGKAAVAGNATCQSVRHTTPLSQRNLLLAPDSGYRAVSENDSFA